MCHQILFLQHLILVLKRWLLNSYITIIKSANIYVVILHTVLFHQIYVITANIFGYTVYIIC